MGAEPATVWIALLDEEPAHDMAPSEASYDGYKRTEVSVTADVEDGEIVLRVVESVDIPVRGDIKGVGWYAGPLSKTLVAYEIIRARNGDILTMGQR